MRKRLPTFFNACLARIADLADRHLAYRWWWYAISAGIALLVCAWYLIGVDHCAGSAYPLDDAWIHQCYARTLAQTGEFAFAPGEPSAGSTSLLWTLLLALGHLVGVAPVAWSYGLGGLAWLLTAWTAQRLFRRLFPGHQKSVPWVALACLLEWHLAWAALSGMEIALFCLLSLLLLERYAGRARPLWLGATGGLLILTRPEGLVLAAAVLLAAALSPTVSAEKRGPRKTGGPIWALLARLLLLSIGLGASLIPYLALNFVLSRQPFPSTLYAKQAEYRILLQRPLWHRLWVVVRRPLVGAQVLLIPGFVWQAFTALRRALSALLPGRVDGRAGVEGREAPPAVAELLPIAWWATLHLLYALRLPVDYQHGRYLMPALPIFLVYGVAGTADRLQWAARGERGRRLLTRVWTQALVLALDALLIGFLVLGGQAYAEDRCIIQGEMVHTALWVRDNTLPTALVAAHDIGALGYWARRPLLDLAGLITPEVIHIMRDEERLIEYIVDREAEYLVTFPSWYPAMVQDRRLTLIYPAETPTASPGARDHMTVYRINR